MGGWREAVKGSALVLLEAGRREGSSPTDLNQTASWIPRGGAEVSPVLTGLAWGALAHAEGSKDLLVTISANGDLGKVTPKQQPLQER